MQSIAARFHPQTPQPIFSTNPNIHNLITRCNEILKSRRFEERHELALLCDDIRTKTPKSFSDGPFKTVPYNFVQSLLRVAQYYNLPSTYKLIDPTWAEIFAIFALDLIAQYETRENAFNFSFDSTDLDSYHQSPHQSQFLSITADHPLTLDAANFLSMAENDNFGFHRHEDRKTVMASSMRRNPEQLSLLRYYVRFYVELGFQSKKEAADAFLNILTEENLRIISPTKNKESAARTLNKYLTEQGIILKRGPKKKESANVH